MYMDVHLLMRYLLALFSSAPPIFKSAGNIFSIKRKVLPLCSLKLNVILYSCGGFNTPTLASGLLIVLKKFYKNVIYRTFESCLVLCRKFWNNVTKYVTPAKIDVPEQGFSRDKAGKIDQRHEKCVKKEAMNGLERSEVPEWPLTFTHNRAAFFYFASHAESLRCPPRKSIFV